VIFLELILETSEQRKRIRGAARKPGDDFIVVQAARFLCVLRIRCLFS